MDIADKSIVEYANEGSPMEVRDPAGNPLTYECEVDGAPVTRPVTMWVMGSDSDAWKKENRKLMEKLTENAQKNKKMTDDEADRENLRMHAAMVFKWEGFFRAGEPLECNAENIIAVLRWGPHIADQLASFVSNRSNFMKA